jgi:hypothetical protein
MHVCGCAFACTLALEFEIIMMFVFHSNAFAMEWCYSCFKTSFFMFFASMSHSLFTFMFPKLPNDGNEYLPSMMECGFLFDPWCCNYIYVGFGLASLPLPKHVITYKKLIF